MCVSTCDRASGAKDTALSGVSPDPCISWSGHERMKLWTFLKAETDVDPLRLLAMAAAAGFSNALLLAIVTPLRSAPTIVWTTGSCRLPSSSSSSPSTSPHSDFCSASPTSKWSG